MPLSQFCDIDPFEWKAMVNRVFSTAACRLLAAGVFAIVTASRAGAQELKIPFASAYITDAATSDPDEFWSPPESAARHNCRRCFITRSSFHNISRVQSTGAIVYHVTGVSRVYRFFRGLRTGGDGR
jgi:hypothetical protein